jgi:hypothetical protein
MKEPPWKTLEEAQAAYEAERARADKLAGALRDLHERAASYRAAAPSERAKLGIRLGRSLNIAAELIDGLSPALIVRPVVVARMPMVTEAGVEIVPFQVIAPTPSSGYGCEIRVGYNMLYFNRDGSFDGFEACTVSLTNAQGQQYQAALRDHGRGERPDSAYFQPGTRGWEAEVAGWPMTPSKAP